jgi:hypothetical protein
MFEHWWSIEVFDAELSANRWRDAWESALVEAAVSNGAKDWNWLHTRWGLVFEVAFTDSEGWAVFRELPVVRAALDATPDPINGIVIYPGRGGSSASRVPRRPRPITGAGSAPIPTETVPALVAAAACAERAFPVLADVA